jgi:hypothetical protein
MCEMFPRVVNLQKGERMHTPNPERPVDRGPRVLKTEAVIGNNTCGGFVTASHTMPEIYHALIKIQSRK